MTGSLAPNAVADEAIQTFGVMLECYRGLERYFASELSAKTPLTHTWFEALLRLASEPDNQQTMSELGARLDLTSGGVTRLVDRLVAAGYVVRTTSPTDRRVQVATLTAEGGRVLESAAEVHAQNARAKITDKLDADELAAFMATLERLRLDPAAERRAAERRAADAATDAASDGDSSRASAE